MYRVNVATKVVATLVITHKEYDALNMSLNKIGELFIAQHPEYKGCTISHEIGKDEDKIFINAVSDIVFTKE